jgi:hypothetical protein
MIQLNQMVIEHFGAQGRNRTTDTVIFSHVLYQLSYLGMPGDLLRPTRVVWRYALPCFEEGATRRLARATR